MKPFPKFAGYILLKWILFYIYQFSGSQTKWRWGNVNGEGLFLATFMLLALPLLELFILFFPFRFALTQKGWMLFSLLILIFGVEFFIGWVSTSQTFEIWMAVKIAFSVGLFGLFTETKYYGNHYPLNEK